MQLTLRTQLGGSESLFDEAGSNMATFAKDPVGQRLKGLLISAIAKHAPDVTVVDEYGRGIVGDVGQLSAEG